MLLNVATITSPVGLKGEVNLFLHTDSPQSRLKKGNILISVDGEEFKIHSVRQVSSKGKNRWIVSFDEHLDRSLAENLKGTVLQIDTDQTQESQNDDDGFYIADLVGLKVMDNGKNIGEITALIPGAQDLLEVKLQNSETNQTILVPFVEKIVPVVDIQARFIEVDLPPGLIEVQSV